MGHAHTPLAAVAAVEERAIILTALGCQPGAQAQAAGCLELRRAW